MGAEVKILLVGYTNADSAEETGEEKTQPTITLVRDRDLAIVVDPGILESQQDLIDALGQEGLTVDEVDVVCVTHSHIDHYRNVGMFPNAKVLEYFGLWDKRSSQDWPEHFSENIQILHTPGHDYTSITIFATTDPDSEYPGVVAICGDVFWKENYPTDPEEDSFASDPVKLRQSREMILKMADWVIPGHGGIFKVDKTKSKERQAAKPASNVKVKPFAVCKKCKRVMNDKLDSCRCRPYLCHYCCECGLDCDLCGCSHKV